MARGLSKLCLGLLASNNLGQGLFQNAGRFIRLPKQSSSSRILAAGVERDSSEQVTSKMCIHMLRRRVSLFTNGLIPEHKG